MEVKNKMRRIPEYTTQIESRICRLKQAVAVDTQTLRNKWITELDDLFEIAVLIAKGKIDQQQVGGKLQSITPKERQMWAQVTANIGQVMGNLAKGYDETQFNEDIDELERLTDEVIAFHNKASEKHGSEESSIKDSENNTGN